MSHKARVTDGQTNGRTNGQNYDSKDRASIAASRGKKKPFLLLSLAAEYRSRRWM